MTDFIIGFLAGAALGAGIALVVSYLRSRAGNKQLRETFSALATEALDANSQRLISTAGSQLDSKKELIEKSVHAVNERLEQVRKYIQTVEAARKEDLGRLSGSVTSLTDTTSKLHEMLASSKRRGAWGERMAEDVLRLAGLAEGINYTKQSSEFAGDNSRPDFTFSLPNSLTVNMDVKFPLDHYKAYLDATDEAVRSESLKALTQAVRGHVKDVARRGYIDPKSGTVPYVIVFLASEQVFATVLEAQPDLLDDALKMKVVLTSPLTLYAMLSVMRQAAEHANLTKTADEVVTLMGQFYKQWQTYNEEVDRLGKQIDTVARQFQAVSTTRRDMLQRPLDKIEQLRTSRGLPEASDE